jgi:Chaperone of endosialidase
MLRKILPLALTALACTFAAPHSAQALCSFGPCKNAVWASGAQKTTSGGISAGARLTPYGVTSGKQTSYGVTSGRQTPYGVTSGHQTSYGVSGGRQTSYGVSAGHQTSSGVTSGQQTSSGVMGAGCRKTAFGVSCSDIRLKRDVEQVARLGNGLGLYRYRYIWSDQVYVGVMAQEVAAVMPAAVVRGSDGYLRVNYARLGLRLQTWNAWAASH